MCNIHCADSADGKRDCVNENRRGFAGKTMAEMAEQMQKQVNDQLNADNPILQSLPGTFVTLWSSSCVTQEEIRAKRQQKPV